MDYSKRQKLIQDLAHARVEAKAGKLSRRDFNTFLVGLAAAAGVSLSQVEEANAWVGTRMRKPKRASTVASGNSLRFDSARTTQLTRTFPSLGDRQTFTLSFWMKSTVSTSGGLLSFNYAGSGLSQSDFYVMLSTGALTVVEQNNNAATWSITTSAVYRDPSAWYHVVVAVDTTQAVASQRAVIYVNGVQQALGSASYPTLNYNNRVSVAGSANHIGCIDNGGGYYVGFDGYLSDFFYVDGQALTPWSFADIDPVTGQYLPKTYSSSFGNNGFYLPFNDATSATTLGYDRQLGLTDSSKNNWTVNNHTVTDQTIDHPTNNFCVFSKLDLDYGFNSGGGQAGAKPSLQNGALRALQYENSNLLWGTFAPRTGKWYFEITMGTVQRCGVGIRAATSPARAAINGVEIGYRAAEWSISIESGTFKVNSNSTTSLSHASPSSKTFQVALDLDAGKIWFGRDNVWLEGNPAAGTGASFTLTTGIDYVPGISFGGDYSTNSHAAVANFGQGGQAGLSYDSASGGRFKYAAPAGFKALSTANLPAPVIAKPGQYFQAMTYIGNGGVQRIGETIPATQSYQVARSLRFNSVDSANLTCTPGTAGNRRTWTLSMWVKRSGLGTAQMLFYSRVYPWSGVNATDFQTYLYFETDDTLKFGLYTNATIDSEKFTSRVFRDSSSWHHVMVAVDTTLATAADRVKIYVDGVAVTDFGTSSDPAQNYQSSMHDVALHHLGNSHASNGSYNSFFNGYMAEVHAISGQQLTPSSFGEVDTTSGEWVPKAYASSYGTTGFYLNFSDNSNTTATTLGEDLSGNGNNWTPTNFTTTDGIYDSPTHSFMTGDSLGNAGALVMTDGNLVMTGSGATARSARTSSFKIDKFYFEAKIINRFNLNYPFIGFCEAGRAGITSGYPASSTQRFFAVYPTGNDTLRVCSLGTFVDTAVTGFSTGDTVMFAYDRTTGKIWYGRNGTWHGGGDPAAGTGATATLILEGALCFFVESYSTSSVQMNFGQGALAGASYSSSAGGEFTYTPPTGYLAPHSGNFNAVSSLAMTNTPDLVWIKSRSAATDHSMFDSVRGAGYEIQSNQSNTQTYQPNGVSQFTKTGFSVSNLASVNTAAATYASWMWKKGPTPGFDIVTYVGNGSTRTLSHSLGAAPAFIGIKSTSHPQNWMMYHSILGPTQYIEGLNTTSNAGTSATLWNNTAPTSSDFTIATEANVNGSGRDFVAYLWSEVPGFSKFSTYIGNASADGPFVWCGFRPAFLMVKCTSHAGLYWNIVDCRRYPCNLGTTTVPRLYANTAAAESTDCGVDLLANGFKIREAGAGAFNDSGKTYIVIAFAEAPFKYAVAR